MQFLGLASCNTPDIDGDEGEELADRSITGLELLLRCVPLFRAWHRSNGQLFKLFLREGWQNHNLLDKWPEVFRMLLDMVTAAVPSRKVQSVTVSHGPAR